MKIGIIGMGLMGTSMALALKKYCKNITIYASDKNTENLQYVIKKNIVDYKLNNRELSHLEVIFIAVPVRSVEKIIENIYPYIDKDQTIVTDMSSTKSYICNLIKEKYTDLIFIGGHPMTGRETSGPEYAEEDLFTNRTYIIMQNENQQKLDILISLLQKLEAQILFMNPEEHDRVVSLTSHLPHLMATSVVNEVNRQEKQYNNINKIMGQGFRDFTRIAACSPDVWQDIFITNKKEIIRQLDKIIENMEDFKQAIITGDEDFIFKNMSKAKDKRIILEKVFKKVNTNEI